MENSIDFKYTKISKILEVNNDMVHNYYYCYYGKLYNKEHTKSSKFKYVLWFDIFDVMEFFNKNNVNNEDIREYAMNIEIPYIYDIKDENDKDNLKLFYKWCNDTIRDYNKIVKFN